MTHERNDPKNGEDVDQQACTMRDKLTDQPQHKQNTGNAKKHI